VGDVDEDSFHAKLGFFSWTREGRAVHQCRYEGATGAGHVKGGVMEVRRCAFVMCLSKRRSGGHSRTLPGDPLRDPHFRSRLRKARLCAVAAPQPSDARGWTRANIKVVLNTLSGAEIAHTSQALVCADLPKSCDRLRLVAGSSATGGGGVAVRSVLCALRCMHCGACNRVCRVVGLMLARWWRGRMAPDRRGCFCVCGWVLAAVFTLLLLVLLLLLVVMGVECAVLLLLMLLLLLLVVCLLLLHGVQLRGSRAAACL
jgi:ferredoxin